MFPASKSQLSLSYYKCDYPQHTEAQYGRPTPTATQGCVVTSWQHEDLAKPCLLATRYFSNDSYLIDPKQSPVMLCYIDLFASYCTLLLYIIGQSPRHRHFDHVLFQISDNAITRLKVFLPNIFFSFLSH